MTPDQTFEQISQDTLLQRVRDLQAAGYRLVQMCATTLPDKKEVTYSFDLNTTLLNLRVDVPSTDAILPSASGIFTCAALYENEMHDLFGISFEGMAFDFRGHLYTTAVKFPFGTTKAPPAPAPKAAPVPKPVTATAATPTT